MIFMYHFFREWICTTLWESLKWRRVEALSWTYWLWQTTASTTCSSGGNTHPEPRRVIFGWWCSSYYTCAFSKLIINLYISIFIHEENCIKMMRSNSFFLLLIRPFDLYIVYLDCKIIQTVVFNLFNLRLIVLKCCWHQQSLDIWVLTAPERSIF